MTVSCLLVSLELFFLYKIFIIIAFYCSVVESRFPIEAEFKFFTLTLPVIKILGPNVRDYNRGIIKRSSEYYEFFKTLIIN